MQGDNFNGLNRKKRNILGQEINVTPLIDILLVIVVLLIVTVPQAISKILINLPNASLPANSSNVKVVNLSLKTQGEIYIEDIKMHNIEQLINKLKEMKAQNHDLPIALKADKGVIYEQIVQVIGALKKNGINKITLVSKVG